MSIPFVKYSGTGNDFVLVDDRNRTFPEQDTSLIQAMCNRHFGIGSDGIMLLRNHPDCDFQMIFFNPDASQSLCGNGSRCAVHYAKELGLTKEEGVFTTTDGGHSYRFNENEEVEISMSDVNSIECFNGMDFVNTGSPHLIINRENLDSIDILDEGRKWRMDQRFAKSGGTNVNFVQEVDSNSLQIRTYERGVEAETLSCGTGVTAAALAKKKGEMGKHLINVQTAGGTLSVKFLNSDIGFSEIKLNGPVMKIFEGVYNVGE